MKPMTDLCWQCQQNSTAVIRSANCSEEEKSVTIQKAEEHLRIVHVERSFYNFILKECAESVKGYYQCEGKFSPPPPSSRIKPNSVAIKAHYAFDFAQQVHFPCDPMQPGPIYFVTTRKCSVFGICCETTPRQINFLTDESGEIGKGANTVISKLHFFFNHHGLDETEVYLHADNCTGQNKNNALIQYFMWRTLTSQHTSITYSFLIVGHTKFSPDWCFGLFKRLYRRTKVGTIADIASVVEKSAVCNVPQVCCDENGIVSVPSYDWFSFLAPHFKRINGIKKYHHFRFTSNNPGVVFMKEYSDSEEESLELLKDNWRPNFSQLPARLEPKGLSVERANGIFLTKCVNFALATAKM